MGKEKKVDGGLVRFGISGDDSMSAKKAIEIERQMWRRLPSECEDEERSNIPSEINKPAKSISTEIRMR